MFQVGDQITFGIYSSKSGAPEPITWIVVQGDEEKLKLITKDVMFSHQFDEERWKDSELRRWLNTDIFDSIFSEEEKQYILESVTVDDTAVQIESDWDDDVVKDYYAGIVSVPAAISRDYLTIPSFSDLFVSKSRGYIDRHKDLGGFDEFMLLNPLYNYHGLFKLKHPFVKFGGFATYPGNTGIRICVWVKSEAFK